MTLDFCIEVRQVDARLRRMDHVRMLERESIARELHDTLLQSLQALIMWVEAAAEQLKLDTDPNAGSRLLEQALTIAQRTAEETRDRIRDLRRETPQFAFAESLRTVVLRFPLPDYVVREIGAEPLWNAQVKGEAYWIIREAIANAARHAKATSISVAICYGLHHIEIEVRDDGCGFDSSTIAARDRHANFGIKGMYERARLIDAELSIVSAMQQGTTVKLKVPIGTEAEAGHVKPRRQVHDASVPDLQKESSLGMNAIPS